MITEVDQNAAVIFPGGLNAFLMGADLALQLFEGFFRV